MAKQKTGKQEEQRSTAPQGVANVQGSMGLRITWIAILVLLGYTMIYNKLQAADESEETAQAEVSAPDFDIANWFDGYYQEKTENYLKNDSRLGKKLLPLKNQLDYKLYNKLSLVAYTVGKDDYFICTDAINAYLGWHAMPDSAVSSLLDKAKVVQDSLSNKGIDLVLVYVPTKEYFMPAEITPAKYLKYPKHRNNYEKFVSRSAALGLHYMDIYSYLNSIRGTAPYPLYTQHGTHMSYYAECLMADTVIKYIERLKGTELPHIAWNDVSLSEEPKVRDNDAIGKSKLMHAAPELKPLAYPNIGYTGSPNARPLKVLGIGDSYYRAFSYLGVTEAAFDRSEYWYYYNSVVPETPDKKEAWEYDLKEKLEAHKAIIVMYSSNNLFDFGNGFIQDAYQLYTDPAGYNARVARERPVKMAKKTIHRDADMMEELQKMANKAGISLDSAINLKASEMVGKK